MTTTTTGRSRPPSSRSVPLVSYTGWLMSLAASASVCSTLSVAFPPLSSPSCLVSLVLSVFPSLRFFAVAVASFVVFGGLGVTYTAIAWQQSKWVKA